MKAKIGNFPKRLRAKFFENHMNKKYGYVNWPKEYTRFEKAIEWLEDRVQDFYDIFNRLWFDRRKQKVNVRIDRWDTWSMDHTLAHIVVPMLKQLKENKHGAPNVDDEDVPEHLRSPNDVDVAVFLHFDRWDWVMDEMIFAFESKLSNWEEQFYSGEPDVYFEKVPGEAGVSQMKYGPKHTFTVDDEGMKAYQQRISNGFRLFGKYFESLWD